MGLVLLGELLGSVLVLLELVDGGGELDDLVLEALALPVDLGVLLVEGLDLLLVVEDGVLVLLADPRNGILRLQLGVLEELAELHELRLPLPVGLDLGIRAALRVLQPVRHGDELDGEVGPLALDAVAQLPLRLQVIVEEADLVLQPRQASQVRHRDPASCTAASNNRTPSLERPRAPMEDGPTPYSVPYSVRCCSLGTKRERKGGESGGTEGDGGHGAGLEDAESAVGVDPVGGASIE